MNITMPTMKISGRFRLVVSKDEECKEVIEDTGFFDNLITDVGLNRIGTVDAGSNQNSPIFSFNTLCGTFVVGSGSAEPQITDTSLQNPVAFRSSGSVALESHSSNYERGWFEMTVSSRFGQGEAQGNLSEIGIQHTSLSGPLWSRALILDGQGNPTTLTVLDTDFLTCYYTLRIMIPKEDAVFNIDVDYDEDGLVPTVVTGRPFRAGDPSARYGWGLKTIGAGTDPTWLYAHTGGLVPPEAYNLSGTQVGSTNSITRVPYVHGSFQRFASYPLSLSEFNSTELRSFHIRALMGCWQMEFDPPLQKNNTQTMQVTFGYSWARS